MDGQVNVKKIINGNNMKGSSNLSGNSLLLNN